MTDKGYAVGIHQPNRVQCLDTLSRGLRCSGGKAGPSVGGG